MTLRRYTSADEDGARWEHVTFRPGDIVVSTRSKHGTTWMQTILLLLIHQVPVLPAPLARLSPWIDHLVEPVEAVVDRLEAQPHRRVLKTHTPLDGVPGDPRVTYIVVARNPLDAAVSLYHQGENIDRERLAQLTGVTPSSRRPAPPVNEWLRGWIDAEADPVEDLDSLAGVFWHLSDAWSRREEPNIVLVRYDDLAADLEGQMRRLAQRLAIDVPDDRWAGLVAGATFEGMRARAGQLAPNSLNVLRDSAAFFRRGRSGAAAELLEPGDIRRYEHRAAKLAPTDLVAWLHRSGA